MPLETFVGPAIGPLLDQVRTRFGPDAVVAQTRRVAHWDGSTLIEILAGDPEAGEAWDPRYITAGNARELTASEAAMMPELGGANRNGPLVIALVGPTGAGKTTTIAKLIGHPRIFGARGAGVISLDTYRVGAVEQLRTYAEITRVPLEVVYETPDIERVRRAMEDLEVVLIDTPGRGPRSRSDGESVDRWLDFLRPDEIHLTLPAGMQPEHAAATVAQYRARGATHLLATKVDELMSDWTVFELAAQSHMPMRWLTDGQEVPAHIRGASPRLLAAMASARSEELAAVGGVA